MIIVLIVCIAFLFFVISARRKGARDDKLKGIIAKIAQLTIVQGVPCTCENQPAFLRLYDDKVTVNEQQTIPLTRIKEVVAFTQKEITNKDKSVVGRAIIGTALLGPLGAVVGGISGVGQKGKSKTIAFLAIHYTDKDGNAETAIFKSPNLLLLSVFLREINKLLSITPGSVRQTYDI